MKKVTAQVYIDSEFPNWVFIKFEKGRIAVARLLQRSLHKDRGIYHYYMVKRNGVRAAISEDRIRAAMDVQRDVCDVRYIPSNKQYRLKKNASLVALVRAKQDIEREHPGIDTEKYMDDAMIRILESGFCPSDYEDIKRFLLKHMLAVKIEKEKRNVPFDDVAYFLGGDEEDLENNETDDDRNKT